jgi:hypothetical protein
MNPTIPPANTSSVQQPTTQNTAQNNQNVANQAAFDQAVFDIAAAELLTDHFVVTQPILDDINKESAK